MAQFAIASEVVFPTFNDVGVVAGDGKRWSEPSITSWVKNFLGGVDFILSGFTVPATSGTLSINVALGEAYLKGYRCVVPGATAVTATASTTTFVFLRVLRDINGFVTSAVFETSLVSTPITDAVLICQLVAGVGTITSTKDLAPRNVRGADINEALIFTGL